MISTTNKFKEQYTLRLAKYILSKEKKLCSPFRFKIIFLYLLIVYLSGCTPYKSVNNNNINNENEKVVISKITTAQTELSKSDVSKYFCNNLTEYFNSYKYYKISSEVYNEKDKQNSNSTTVVLKKERLYIVKYIGSSGWYSISFSNRNFKSAEEIYTFRRLTVLGNAIRSKVYDTFTAWISREEIALKANSNSNLFVNEINAAVEIENWYNNLSVSEE